MKKPPKIVWTIAGSDSGAGAGIQADMATAQDLGCHCACVITTVTAQNSVSVSLIESVSAAMLLAQLNSLARDLPPAAIKIGLLASQQQLNVVANWLKRFHASTGRGIKVPVIVDPVMIASSGDRLNLDAKLDFSPFKGVMTLITPNQQELGALTQQMPLNKEALANLGGNIRAGSVAGITDEASFVEAATLLANELDCNVLAKGGDSGHWQGKQAIDCYVCHQVEGVSALHDNHSYLLKSPRVNTGNNHGTGCTLSAAIASFLAQDWVLHDAIVLAKAYVTKGLINSYQLGAGPGSLARTGWPKELELFPNVTLVSESALQDQSIQDHSLDFVAKDNTLSEGFVSLSTDLGVYPVVDSLQLVTLLLDAGCKTLQLRLKAEHHSLGDIEMQIAKAISLAREHKAQLFINDHWQLALKYGAFGLHLGQEDLAKVDLAALRRANIALGLSSHSYFEVLCAHSIKPSYIALGHIFPTPTKSMPSKPQGLNKLTHYVQLLKGHYPTVAIGGIDETSLEDIKNTGVDNIAVVRAVTHAVDPKAAFLMLQRRWQESPSDNAEQQLASGVDYCKLVNALEVNHASETA
jgi:hydroxymethylpyrimidine kinase/phosphomethylpyrimidine kinase/thiamine-phosphate diphosphorylase